VTKRFAIGQFLLVVHGNRSSISCHFKIFAYKYIWVTITTFLGHLMLFVTWDNRPQTFRGHDLDLYRSRNVIGHVTIRLPIPYFLFVLHCDQAPISSPFRDIRPQSPVRTHRHTDTRRKWFYILSHAMYCIGTGQTTTSRPVDRIAAGLHSAYPSYFPIFSDMSIYHSMRSDCIA